MGSGRRETIMEPLPAIRKSAIPFAPARTKIYAIAPSIAGHIAVASTNHIAGDGGNEDVSSGSSATERSPDDNEALSYGGNDKRGTDDDSDDNDNDNGSEKEPPEPSSSSQEYIYSLQDENCDLQKRIHRLEMVLRDNGFDKDGKQIISARAMTDDAAVDKRHVEMMSMMGMDPERPTVLTKYMEFKVFELQDELEVIELDREAVRRLNMKVRCSYCDLKLHSFATFLRGLNVYKKYVSKI